MWSAGQGLAHLIGISLLTACVTTQEVYNAIVNILLWRCTCIRIPTGESIQTAVDSLLHRWGFPHCFGASDGFHIPILSHKSNPQDYFNRKCFHSIVSQALVDHEYKFMNTYIHVHVHVGWPGSVHNASILSNFEA